MICPSCNHHPTIVYSMRGKHLYRKCGECLFRFKTRKTQAGEMLETENPLKRHKHPSGVDKDRYGMLKGYLGEMSDFTQDTVEAADRVGRIYREPVVVPKGESSANMIREMM